MKMPKERFKITVNDRQTGQKTIYYAHGPGFATNSKLGPEGLIVVRMVLDYPRVKVKTKDKK